MEKGKKPPPGATLIQRMREARMRREQSIASDKGAPASAPDAVRVVAAPAAAKTNSAPPAVQPTNIIRRSISIGDLRPISDDYDQLTEEIRLAGRFAAAGLIAQGLRLSRLKDDALYRQHYPSFEDYCRTEHSMSATYAYRLIRMAEMAEHLADGGSKSLTSQGVESMPDPFEVMLGLGHRHLMALLPLETEAAEDLLIRGIPLFGESGKGNKRIPITSATEQQIRQAINSMVQRAVQEAVRKTNKKSPLAVPAAGSVRNMADLIEVLQEWAEWLESEPQASHVADKIGKGREIGRLAQQLRKASDRICEALTAMSRVERIRKH